MPPVNFKNFAGTAAATDLGLGDKLAQQLADQQDELRKRKQAEMMARMGQAPGPFGPATLALLGNPTANLNGGL
jgi:hypothetical protein